MINPKAAIIPFAHIFSLITPLFPQFLRRKLNASIMEKKEINQKQNQQQGSSSHAGKKASKKKPYNSALRCRTNSNLATKTCKARGGKGIGTLRRRLKTVVESMEAKTVEMRREREGIMEILATAEEIKLELNLLKISIYQHSHDMLRTSEALDKLAEIMLLQLD